MQTTPFTSGVISAVDCFLNIAARLLQDFPHFAGHISRVTILVPDQDLA